MVIDIEEHAVW